MSNFDFTSIGHILIQSNKATEVQNETTTNSVDVMKKRLRNFCEKLFETLSVMSLRESFKGINGSLFLGDNKSLLEKFDLFFQNLVPSVDTFSKFIDCILKKSSDDTDDIRFEVQNHAEKVVWDKFVYLDLLRRYGDEHVTFLVEHKKDLFHLFCLFNRFANEVPEKNSPPLLSSRHGNFIFKKLDTNETVINKPKIDINLHEFLELFRSEKILIHVLGNIKTLYNEYVKDLIKEELATCRVVPMKNRQSITSFSSSLYSMENYEFRSFGERMVSVTSRYVRIREETKTVKGKKSKKYYKLPLFNSEIKVAKPLTNVLNKLNGSTTEMRMSIKPSTTASQKSSNSSYIELSFNANVDHYLLYQWTKAIEDGIDLSRARTNRLIKTLEQFDANDTACQALRRGQTFKVVSPLKKLSADLGGKSQSSSALNCDIIKEEPQKEGDAKNGENSGESILRQRTAEKNTSKFRQSMMNDLDSD